MVLVQLYSVSPQFSTVLQDWTSLFQSRTRFETGNDSEDSPLAEINRLKSCFFPSDRWASSNSETSFFLSLLLVLKMKLWITLKWAHFRHERNSGALFFFFLLDRICGLGLFVSVSIRWEEFPQMSLLKEYYICLQNIKAWKDHFLSFLVTCISGIYFGILKTKLITSAYRYYWLLFKCLMGL